ncbi:hypothetical protein [Stigmatella erecta]|uniref:Uncharacterized protein n=1 Tax=Stigmatella erecta TaxID=83460 RepID=A0A1I0JWA7_9BACT|nr:hypothetical protein [Stigmatella erecta]SEU15269.1 hypothetical protein SAMN05443639_108193 [Stigmatella erecta]
METARQSLVLTGQKFVVNGDMGDDNERCRVPSSLLGGANFRANRQLLIRRGTTLRGLCTVDVVASTSGFFEMSEDGFSRRVWLNSDPSNDATGYTVEVSNQYAAGTAPGIAEPATSLTDANTNSAGKVKEYTARASGAQVAYTVPHPFEKYTFEQAELIHNADPVRNAIWALGIDNNVSGTLNYYHITSAEISGASFPGLGSFFSSQITNAVSFHGELSCGTSEVRVGGAIEPAFRQGVAEIIRAELNDPSLRVHWKSGICFDGTAPANFVNAMSIAGRGLQLEQDSTQILGNATRRNKVATATKSVFDCLIDGADNSPTSTPSTPWSVSSGTAAYATSGDCGRYIAEIEVPNVPGGHTLSAGASTCVAGHTAHVDYYRWTGVGYWVRIGGGNITYVNSGTTCSAQLSTETDYTYLPPGVVGSGSTGTTRLRAVVRASDASGAAVPAFFSVQ